MQFRAEARGGSKKHRCIAIEYAQRADERERERERDRDREWSRGSNPRNTTLPTDA